MTLRSILMTGAVLALASCGGNTAPGNDRESHLDPARAPLPVASAAAAVQNADVTALQFATMTREDAAHALGAAPACAFILTRSGDTAIAFSTETGGQAVVKLNGELVLLSAAEGSPEGSRGFISGPVRVTVSTLGGGEDADARVWIGEENLRGYRGYYRCSR